MKNQSITVRIGRFIKKIGVILSLFLAHLFKIIVSCRWSFLTLLIFYYVLWHTDQGHDLLIGMLSGDNEFALHAKAVLSYFLIYCLAAVVWFSPRFIYPVGSRPEEPIRKNNTDKISGSWLKRTADEFARISQKNWKSERVYRRFYSDLNTKKEPRYLEYISLENFPRFLGAGVFFVAGFGLMKTYLFNSSEVFSKYTHPMLFLSLIFLIILIGWLNRLKKRRTKGLKGFIYILVAAVYFSVLAGLAFLSKGAEGLFLLGIGFLFSGLLFAAFTVFRTNFMKDQRLVFWLLLGLASAVLLFFFIVNIRNITPGTCFKFPFFFLAITLIFYLTFITGITGWLRRHRVHYLVSFIILLYLFLIPKNDHHDVRTVRDESITEFPRLNFENYLKDRLEERIESSDSVGQIPIFLVTTQGGGSRAALWTSAILSQLDEQSNGKFSNHTFSISGASGGMVGATHYYAAKRWLKEKNKKPESNFKEVMRKTFENDFLSTTLVYTLGRDVFFNYCPDFLKNPFDADDRAEKLEKEWTLALQNSLEGADKFTLETITHDAALDRPYEWLYFEGKNYQHPLTEFPILIYSPASVKSGMQGCISPFEKEEEIFSNSKFILKAIHGSAQNESLRLSTAAGLNGRFPYINPSGYVPQLDEQFVDAGYYDNNGGVKAYEVLKKCREIIQSSNDSTFKRIKFYAVSIFNGSEPSYFEGRESQLFSVPKGGLNTLFSRAMHGTDHLKSEVGEEQYLSFSLMHKDSTESDEKVIMPLARYLSAAAAGEILNNLNTGGNREAFNKIEKLFKK